MTTPPARQSWPASPPANVRMPMPDVIDSDAIMDVMMITCATTGKPIPAGLVAEFDSWCVMEIGPQRCGCPECGKLHQWEKNEAWLHKDRPRRPSSRSA